MSASEAGEATPIMNLKLKALSVLVLPGVPTDRAKNNNTHLTYSTIGQTQKPQLSWLNKIYPVKKKYNAFLGFFKKPLSRAVKQTVKTCT